MYQYTFADNLCKYCKEKNISVAALAELTGKSTRQIARYRNGQCENIPLSTVEKIAEILQVSINDLLS